MPSDSRHTQLLVQLGEFVGNVAIICHDPDEDDGLSAHMWATDMITGLRKAASPQALTTLADFRRLYANVVRECLKALEGDNG